VIEALDRVDLESLRDLGFRAEPVPGAPESLSSAAENGATVAPAREETAPG